LYPTFEWKNSKSKNSGKNPSDEKMENLWKMGGEFGAFFELFWDRKLDQKWRKSQEENWTRIGENLKKKTGPEMEKI
jgi:hypothetical protein